MKFSEGEGRRAVSLWAQFIIVITGGMRLSGGWTRLNNGVSQSVIWRERIRGRILVNTLAPVERIVCRVHVEFFFLFLFFLSFFSLVSLLSLSRSSSFASLYLYPSNFQRRRKEEKKRTCTNNPDLSFLVSFFFFPPFFPLSFSVSSLRFFFSGRFRNFFGIEVSRNRERGGREEGRLESSIVRETAPSAILPHSDNKLRVSLLSRLSVYCEFQVDKGFFLPLSSLERRIPRRDRSRLLLINWIII